MQLVDPFDNPTDHVTSVQLIRDFAIGVVCMTSSISNAAARGPATFMRLN